MHFVFKCKIINNALILEELSYMLLNICCLQLVFHPDDVSRWKTNIFRLGTLCAIMKSVEVWFILWFYFLLVSSQFGILNHALIWVFDIIWTILCNKRQFFCLSLLWVPSWFNWCFVQFVSHLVLENFVHV